uniref:Uncharacterized protein n=1 Tax=Anguilla anguilla TaxID=7936 RepID=A0A0E9SEM6_ANGAN
MSTRKRGYRTITSLAANSNQMPFYKKKGSRYHITYDKIQ